MWLSLFLCFIGAINSRPLFLGIIILLSAVVFGVIGGIYLGSFWFSYILILVYVGGLIVLFIYVASLAANELMYFYKISFALGMRFIVGVGGGQIGINFYDREIILVNKLDYSGLYEIYGGANYFLILFLGGYLLLTLMGTVKIMQLHRGPLRQMF